MRPIDADALFDFLTEQLDKETGAYSKGRNAGINIARSALHDKTITPTITLPPNDPLTLGELREMDGEPVYVTGTFTDCRGERPGAWALVDVKQKMCRVHGGGLAIFENCGKHWLAYRRKPEELT